MKHFQLELSDKTYQRLKELFKGDISAISDFAVKAINNELSNFPADEIVADSEKNKTDLKDYLKSTKPGSRSYGIKGQGW